MKKALKFVLWALVAAFVILTFFFLWRQSRPASETYELLKPVERTIYQSSIATGQIQPRREVYVKPRITGILTQINVKVGQEVATGDIIARVSVIPDMSSYNDAQSAVEASNLQLQEAQRDYDRSKALYEGDVISREEFEKATHNLSLAKENAAKAQSSLDIILYGSSKRSGSVNTTIVKATMSGKVIDLPLKQGASVVSTSPYSEGTTIATIADVSDMIFDGKIDETEVDRLTVGTPARITVGSSLDRHITGTLEEISSMGVKENGTVMFSLKASVDSDDGTTELRAGYSANAEFITAQADNVISIEETAIAFEDGGTYVYKLVSAEKKDQKFERIPVVTGLSDGIYIEIKEGVTEDMVLRGNKLN
ncbi:MAG: efflux RND transporter periplasmic adaptor subunit [Bacteroidales bacterium]|nr:efflux RND transporter periplasmic adaptor subunit [Bacteroidales bacterium]MBR5670284.1 efflux RND transporter periplasmic adaptor subunit [Bacteroidales bacterium]